MKELFFIFAGGGIGSVMRYMVSLLWMHLSLHPRFSQTVFPWPTLVVNVLGCLVISLIYQHSERWPVARDAPPAHNRSVWRFHNVLHIQL